MATQGEGLATISPPLAKSSPVGAKRLPHVLLFFDASPMEANGSLPLAMALRSHWRTEIRAFASGGEAPPRDYKRALTGN
ncbi:hypothetical protein R1flu_025437 [Riccia fluitans]|uniref:Uncharacterized protein n=1 Tax=Riccia fluitans TaxID=41844 RepID=A0ABD1XXR4_9MARC